MKDKRQPPFSEFLPGSGWGLAARDGGRIPPGPGGVPAVARAREDGLGRGLRVDPADRAVDLRRAT